MRHLLVPLAALALVAGCTPDVAPTGSPSVFPSPTVSASPSPTPSPSPSAVESFPPAPATESPEQAAIRAAWMEYWRVFEGFASDPTLTDFTELQNLVDGEEATVALESIRNLRDSGRRTEGGFQFRDVVVSVPAVANGLETATVVYCLDRSGLVMVDIDTGTPPDGDPLPNLKETATLVQGTDSTWRISQVRNEATSC